MESCYLSNTQRWLVIYIYIYIYIAEEEYNIASSDSEEHLEKHKLISEFLMNRSISTIESSTLPPMIEEVQVIINGKTKHLLLKRISIIFDNEQSIGLIIQDLTPTKMAEREKLSQEFQSRLVKTITHEIRTPLNAISGSAEILESIYEGNLRENQTLNVKVYLKTIQNGIKFLLNFVDCKYIHIVIYI